MIYEPENNVEGVLRHLSTSSFLLLYLVLSLEYLSFRVLDAKLLLVVTNTLLLLLTSFI